MILIKTGYNRFKDRKQFVRKSERPMTKEEWLNRYEKALVAYGVPEKLAHDNALGMEVDLSFDPEGAAADEVSYMADDSDRGKK